MSGDVVEIRMQTRGAVCWYCRKDCDMGFGLPVFNGDLMSNDWPGEWGAVPACRKCFEAHERGELETCDECYEHLLGGFRDGGGI